MNRNFLSNWIDQVGGRHKNNHNLHPISNALNYEKNLSLGDCILEEIFPHLLVYSSMATIENNEKMWTATSMLVRLLQTFTNNLVVLQNEIPAGVLGGRDALKEFYKNPTSDFFFNTTVNEVMDTGLYVATSKTRFADLLDKMRITGRDFAIIENNSGNFSTISARRLLEAGILSRSDIKLSDVPYRPVITFTKDSRIGDIIKLMIDNNAEFLVLENTSKFIDSQIIFEKIANDYSYLDGTNNFLDLNGGCLKLKNVSIISQNTKIPEICKIMLNATHSIVMTSDRVLTPWDVVSSLHTRDLRNNC